MGHDGSSGLKASGKSSKIYGSLGSVSLTDILQLLGMSRRTATVAIRYRDKEGEILFRDGLVVHAAAGSVSGEDALLRLVNWAQADFTIDEGVRDAAPETISKSVDAVMLQVLTRLDEAQLDGGTVFTPATPMDKIDLAALEDRLRAARPKPRPPARRNTAKLVTAVVVALTVAASSTTLLFWLDWGVDADSLPPVIDRADMRIQTTSSATGVATEVLEATMGSHALDTAEVLDRYGLSLSAAAPERPSAEPKKSRDQTANTSPALREGRLLVIAEPWGELTIDGRSVGETPLPEMTLVQGEHEIVLYNPNVVGVIRDRVDVKAGETTSVRYSFLDAGVVRIVVSPWADVYIDGRHVGQTPLDELEVPVGTHSVTLRHPSLGEKVDTVVVFAGESTVLRVEM